MLMKSENLKNIITIGTSAGGISAVSRLVSAFHEDLDAAVFIVIHVSRNSMVGLQLYQTMFLGSDEIYSD